MRLKPLFAPSALQLLPSFDLFPSQHLQLGFSKLINIMNRFRGSPFPQSQLLEYSFSVAC